jgi:hypothetical protein
MKGKLKVRNIAPGFDEIFLQVHSGRIYKTGAAISCTNYFVDRRQWPEIVKQKLIDTEVEFEENKSISTEGKPVTYAKVVLPSEKTYTQAEVIAIVDEARDAIIKQSLAQVEEIGKSKYKEGWDAGQDSLGVFGQIYLLQHKAALLNYGFYSPEEVEELIHKAWNDAFGHVESWEDRSPKQFWNENKKKVDETTKKTNFVYRSRRHKA